MSVNHIQRRRFLVAGLGAVTAASGSTLWASESETKQIAIDCDFPGGNIVVERIEGDRVYLHQDPRDTAGFWFYWYFRVRGGAGRTLTFHFTKGNVLGVRGPAVSTDDGKTWQWLGADAVKGASFTYTMPKKAQAVRFCLAVPYQESDLGEFLKQHAGNKHLKVEHHSTTKKDRKTRRLLVGQLDGEPAHRVLIACRHHSCEMMASYSLEGIIDAALADTPQGKWFRQNVQFAIVPFMDKDGVEQGDQGKNRKPYDHNRDYLGQSIYPSVAALRDFVPKWSGGKLKIALDMHCPWIRGGANEQIFFVGARSPEMWKRQLRFSRTLQQVQTGPLVHDPKHNIPWGKGWNNRKEPKSCGAYAALLPGMQMAVTIEIPYANAGGKPVTADSARRLGHDLARTMYEYLRNP